MLLAIASHVVGAIPCAVLWNGPYRGLAVTSSLLSYGANVLATKLIPHFASKLRERGIAGVDLNKLPPAAVAKIRAGGKNQVEGAEQIPEAGGIVPAFTYLVVAVLEYLVIKSFYPENVAGEGEGSRNAFPLHYLACLLSISMMTFLGFIDDVIDLRWRYKVVLPFLATIPALVIYEGPTTVVMPSIAVAQKVYRSALRPLFNLLGFFEVHAQHHSLTIDFGWFYYTFMGLISCFCANCINIYAGINGLEVGQSLISVAFLIVYNSIELYRHPDKSHEALAMVLSLIFFNVSLALFKYNRFPSRVFVGDTFTMFAGVHFGIVSILGHYSKMVILMFIPQIINATYSIPQLLKIVPCPRHRVPYMKEDGLLHSSRNYTLINLTLELLGPMTERTLVNTLLAFQFLCCSLGMLIRYSPSYASTFA